jgi:hypothetical protein
MERLLVDRKNRNLRVAVLARIVEGADLDDHCAGKAWRPAHDLGSASGAEFAGHGGVEVAARKCLPLTGPNPLPISPLLDMMSLTGPKKGL